MTLPADRIDKRQHPNPSDRSPLVDFYLERQQFMDPAKDYSIPITVNGFQYFATFGQRNRLPKDVVDVLRNAKSAIHPSPNAGKVEIARGGEGRPQSQLLQGNQEIKYRDDYHVVEEKEL